VVSDGHQCQPSRFHRLRQHCAGATERKRRHRRVSRRNAGIAGEAGDPHHPVVLLEERHQGVVIDGPVFGHAIEALDAEIGRMQARKMRRIHDCAAAHAVEVHDLDRRVVVVDRVVLGPGTDVGTGGIVAKGTRLPVASRARVRRGVHPVPLLEAEDVHPRVGETPGHGRAGRAGADDQHIHGIVHAALSCICPSMPRSALEMQCRASLVTRSGGAGPCCPWVATFRFAAANVMVSLQQEIGPRLRVDRLEREYF